MNVNIYFQIWRQTRHRSTMETWKVSPLSFTLFNLLRWNRAVSSPRINQRSKLATLLPAIATSQALATLEHWQCCHSGSLFVEQKLICCPLSSEAFVVLYTREVRKITTGNKRSGQFLLAFYIVWACHTNCPHLFGYWNQGKQLRLRSWHLAVLNPCLQCSNNWQYNCQEASVLGPIWIASPVLCQTQDLNNV